MRCIDSSPVRPQSHPVPRRFPALIPRPRTNATPSMDELLEFLAKSLVDDQDAVSVTRADEEDAVVLELRVAEDDTGQGIGRRGRTISALRTVMRAVGASQDQRVLVDLVD